MRIQFKPIMILLIFIALLLSMRLGYFLYALESKNIQIEFQKDVTTNSLSIERELVIINDAVISLKNFFDNSHSVETEEFRNFSTAILRMHSDIKTLSWLRKLPHSDRKDYDGNAHYFEQQLSVTERNNDQQMIAAKHRDVYFPVTYVEPIAGNESTFGFDVGSTIARRQTLDRAIVTGKIAMTPSVTLVQETTAKKGFFIVAPVFKKSTQQSSHGSLNKLEGFVMSIFVAEELVLNALKNTAEKNIQLILLNQSSVTPETLYIHNPDIDIDKAIHFHYQLAPVDNQDWRVEAFPSKTYVSNKRTHNPLIIALLVFLFFSAAIMYIFRQHKNSVIIKKAVQERTLELNEARKALERMTLVDQLTDVANRRHFDEYMMKEWKRGQREKTPLTMLIIDIDYFKQFNDVYGHLAGDKCLQRVAKGIDSTIHRAGDLLARYGGEEFVIIAPNTADGYILSELCRLKIEAMTIPHNDSKISDNVTVSIGFATVIPSKECKPEDLFKKADEALYKAKASGRNQSATLSFQ